LLTSSITQIETKDNRAMKVKMANVKVARTVEAVLAVADKANRSAYPSEMVDSLGS
jgi:hypothetical protein